MAQDTDQERPLDRLKSEASGLAGAMAKRAISAARDKVEGTTERLTDYAENGGGPGLAAAVTGAKDLAEGKSPARAMLGAGTSGLKDKVSSLFGGKGKGGGGRQKLKLTNIVESIDVGVPLRVAYDQWTQFTQFPTFMKKVESVDQPDDEKLNWKAQVFWSHRTWEATIRDQKPDERIVWQSKGQKGHVNGAVTFHELGPRLTRIIVILEYHPQGMFERTGNLWRAQGRRARLELKHFQRHVMTQTILNPDELEGWRGVIEDGEVVKDHETAVEEEQSAEGSEDEDQGPEDEDQGPEDEAPEEEPEDEAPEDREEDETEDDESADENETADDEEPDEEETGRTARRRTARTGTSRSGTSKAGTAGRRSARSTTRRERERGGKR